MRHAATLSFCVLLAACGTPQERCIQRETRDLRTVEKLIVETEGNLKRGYALEQVTVWRDVWADCPIPAQAVLPPGTPAPAAAAPGLCLDEVAETVTRPKAINLADEREKLVELRRKRDELSAAAAKAIAQCRAEFPE